jgi:hypothetical protein
MLDSLRENPDIGKLDVTHSISKDLRPDKASLPVFGNSAAQ